MRWVGFLLVVNRLTELRPNHFLDKTFVGLVKLLAGCAAQPIVQSFVQRGLFHIFVQRMLRPRFRRNVGF